VTLKYQSAYVTIMDIRHYYYYYVTMNLRYVVIKSAIQIELILGCERLDTLKRTFNGKLFQDRKLNDISVNMDGCSCSIFAATHAND